MADLFQIGSDWLTDQLNRHASQPVTYRRGNDSAIVQATIGRTVFEVEPADGILHRIESRDFLILADELVLAGDTTLPEAGDEIEDDGFVYEVLAPGGEPAYRYSDSYRKLLRIHTKLVD